MVVFKPSIKTWCFIILHVGDILEHNKCPALSAELSCFTHDLHPLMDVVNLCCCMSWLWQSSAWLNYPWQGQCNTE